MRERDWGLAPRRIAATGVALIAATLLAGVGGTLALASAKALPKAMAGCWHRHAPALPVGTAAGVWLMQIKSGELSAFTPGMRSCKLEPDFTGTISVSGSHLTIGPLPVCPDKASYTWKSGATTLALKAVKDDCPSRKLLFTGVWKKT